MTKNSNGDLPPRPTWISYFSVITTLAIAVYGYGILNTKVDDNIKDIQYLKEVQHEHSVVINRIGLIEMELTHTTDSFNKIVDKFDELVLEQRSMKNQLIELNAQFKQSEMINIRQKK